MRVRYVIEVRSSHECPECVGTDRAHLVAEYKHTLPDGTPAELQAGDIYFSESHEPGPYDGCPWDNCDGKHLYCLCPDKERTWHGWNIDGRASNCTMKEDRLHRCWVRHGSPADGTIHVDKKGLTCSAGAGSIQTGSWHGFLHNGDLHP